MTVAIEATETTVQQLLEGAERGETVRLQRNGQTVAIVSPAQPKAFPARTPEQIAEARAALARMDELSARLGLKFDFEEFKADKEHGRR